MDMMKKEIITIIFFVICIIACQNQANKNVNTSQNDSELQNESVKEIAKGKYAIKSGVVVYKTQMMGFEVKQTLSFDDFGQKEATDVMMEMMGTTIHNKTITKEGFIYTIDMVRKTGTKSQVQAINNSNIDFQNLTDEMIKEMNLKKEGYEEFLGKNCEKMSIDYVKMQMKGTFLVYKGIPLKVDTEMGTMKMNLVAEKLEENVQIPAEMFEIQSDISIIDN